MIKEFSVKLKPSNENARYAFVICMAIAFVLVMLSNIIPLYRGVVSLLGMIFLVAALTVYNKYMVVTYYYDIMVDSSGRALFLVRSHISNRLGGKNSTLCRIELADIVKIEEEGRATRRKHKTPSGYRKYCYVPTLMPKNTSRLTVHSRYEKSEIVIEGGESLSTLLLEYAEEARQTRAFDE